MICRESIAGMYIRLAGPENSNSERLKWQNLIEVERTLVDARVWVHALATTKIGSLN
jgi:hypothetical protein